MTHAASYMRHEYVQARRISEDERTCKRVQLVREEGGTNRASEDVNCERYQASLTTRLCPNFRARFGMGS